MPTAPTGIPNGAIFTVCSTTWSPDPFARSDRPRPSSTTGSPVVSCCPPGGPTGERGDDEAPQRFCATACGPADIGRFQQSRAMVLVTRQQEVS